MITDREMDTLLAGAAGIDDAALPALPEDFLDVVRADAADGMPDFLVDVLRTDSEPASVLAARQLVEDARTGAYRRRRPRRRTVVRIGVAVVAVAAACVTAVVTAPQDRATPPGHATSPSGTAPAGGIALVSAEEVTFPLTLEPAPEGLTPTFSRQGGAGPYADQPLVYTADYESADNGRVLVQLFDRDPRESADSGVTIDGDADGTVTVDGREAEVRHDGGAVSLLWRRADGRWLRLLGEGAYARTAALVPVAESIVDRPQPIGLQFRLAPAGWSVIGYEESRSLDLASDADPKQLLRLSVFGPGPGLTVDTPFEGMSLAGPVEPVTIQGLPGRMALAQGDVGSPDYWFVVGQFPAGRFFLLLAPKVLTQEQVLDIAEQATYTP